VAERGKKVRCQGCPIEVKPVEVKPVEVKPVEVEPVEVEPVEAQPVEAQPIDAQPIEVKPVAKNQCAYHWETERGLRQCTTRAHWHTDDWDGPDGANLCTKHYRYLRSEGYIDHPAVPLD
jgi:hypothetical protein